MTRAYLALLCAAFFFFSSDAQTNLLRNPSFEQTNTCLLDTWGIDKTWSDDPDDFEIAPFWFSANNDSPDYYNACQSDGANRSVPINWQGIQPAKIGAGYMGIGLYAHYATAQSGEAREYLETKLPQPLQKGVIYCGKFFASPTYPSDATGFQVAIRNFGISLTHKMLKNDAPEVLFDPTSHTTIFRKPEIEYSGPIFTDTSGWFAVNGLYRATGGEEWLTIGNFRRRELTDTVIIRHSTAVGANDIVAYYYIDDVSLQKISDPIFETQDTAVCDFPVWIEAIQGFDNYKWNTGETTRGIWVNGPGIFSVNVDLNECGNVLDTIRVTRRIIPKLALSDTSICESNLPLKIGATAGFLNYEWNDGTIEREHIFQNEGLFSIIATSNCDVQKDSFQLSILKEVPVFDLGETASICFDGLNLPIELRSNLLLDNYQWSTGETTPSIWVDWPGIYALYSKSDCNEQTDSIRVEGCPTKIYAPNVFSPNDDGENDRFLLFTQSVEEIELFIFDRWGELIYVEKGNNLKGWDGRFRGKDAALGTYVWRAEALLPNGERIRLAGDVTLIR